jgi:hypothetical protein
MKETHCAVNGKSGRHSCRAAYGLKQPTIAGAALPVVCPPAGNRDASAPCMRSPSAVSSNVGDIGQVDASGRPMTRRVLSFGPCV